MIVGVGILVLAGVVVLVLDFSRFLSTRPKSAVGAAGLGTGLSDEASQFDGTLAGLLPGAAEPSPVPTAEPPQVPVGWSLHELPEEGFAVGLPPGWKKYGLGAQGVGVALNVSYGVGVLDALFTQRLKRRAQEHVSFAAFDVQSDNTSTLVAISREPISQLMGRRAVFDRAYEQLQQSDRVVGPVVREPVEVAAGHSEKLRYQMSLSHISAGGGDLAVVDYLLAEGSSAYKVRFATGANQADRYELVFESIIGTFKRLPSLSATQFVPPYRVRKDQLKFPPLGVGVVREPGVRFHILTLQGSQLWVYFPEGGYSGQPFGCVLIAPAGSNLVTGAGLTENDRSEHLPYVRAGLAVVAYEIAGALPNPDSASQEDWIEATRAFQSAQAGLVNARDALEFVLAKLPQVSPDRIYAAGHNSAGTLALLLAEHEPRIRGCVAYAPVYNVEKWLLSQPGVQGTSLVIPGFGELSVAASPRTCARLLSCPVFLFHSQDDDIVPVEESIEFAQELERLGKNVTLVTASSGDHEGSMRVEGIPKAIEWLKALSQRP